MVEIDLRALENIGLTKNQIKIYVSLLKLGEANAQEIIKESGMHRSRVYDSLELLEQHGIVSSIIKDYKKYFQAIKPEKLINYLNEKKEALKQIIPELKKIEGIKKEKINASVYKGQEGLKAIHIEMLKEGKEVLVLGAKGLIFSEFPYFTPNFGREMKKKRIKMICLWDDKEAMEKSSGQDYIKSKLLPKGFSSKGVVNIFGNKVAIVLWKEKYPTAFLIDNEDIADSYRKWFELIFRASN